MVRIDPSALAFDVDGVVADTMSLFIEIARDRYGIEGIRYEDITTYSLEECLPIDPDITRSIVDLLIDGTHSSPLQPLPGSVAVLSKMARTHGPLVFVTARPRLEPIEAWLHAALPLAPHDMQIVATGGFESKIEVLRGLGRGWFVEDRLETCILMAREGIRPVVFRQPWNRRPHCFPEVSSWEELEACLDL